MNTKLKVLHIIPSLAKGGAERLVLDICNELFKRENIEVKLVIFTDINEYSFLCKNFQLIVIKSRYIPSLSGKPTDETKELFRFIEEFSPHIIHSHLYEAEIVTRQMIFPDTIYITHCHFYMPQFRNFNLSTLFSKSKLTNYYEKTLLIKKYIECNNQFIAISKDTYNFFKNNLPRKLKNNITLFPNAIDFNRFYNEKTSAGSRKIISKEKINLISVGSLIRRKNHQFLVNVVKQLREKNYNIFLDIIGEGRERGSISESINNLSLNNYIRLMGNIDEPEVFLNNSDIYVHSAIYESFGLTTLEAMASGLPCIALDAGGNRDIIKNAYNGYLITSPDVNEFCDKIELLINNPSLYAQMSKNAIDFVRKYDIKEYVDKLVEYYYQSSVNRNKLITDN